MTQTEILAKFEKKRNKVDIMWEALDYMNQYNGRTPTECVGLAMGLTNEQAYNEE